VDIVQKTAGVAGPVRYPQPQERFGNYRIESFLEEDKSGRIIKAYDEISSRPVCLKILSTDLTRNPAFPDVLRIQMQAASSINHPGIVPLYELGTADSLYFIASEWCPGSWLSQHVIKRQEFSLHEAVDIVMQCAEALHTAAAKGLFHGNLRPNSILIYPDGQIKISEMGFVAAVRALFGSTDLPVYLGTARFLAPEMTVNGTVDFRSDIYSLGLIFYFLMFGVTPFRYEGQQLTGKSETTEADQITQVLKIVGKMTENNPNNRYQDYPSLLVDLRGLMAVSADSVSVPAVKSYLGGSITNQIFKTMSALYASGTSGVLSVEQDSSRRHLYIRNREIIFFESNRPDDNIWNWLVEKKEISPANKPPENETFQRALNRVLTRKLMRLEDFRYRYQELAVRVLSDIMRKPFAQAEFASAEIMFDSLITLRLGDLLLKSARHTVDFSNVLSDIKPDSFLNRTGLFDLLISGLTLTAEEGTLVSHSREGIYTGNLKIKPGSNEEKGIRFLYLLKQIGALEMKTAEVSGAPDMKKSGQTKKPQTVLPEADYRDFGIEDNFEPDEHHHHEEDSDLIATDAVRMEVHRTASRTDLDRLDQEAQRRYEQAKDNYSNGKFWEAASLCEQALGLHEDGKLYWLMGLSYAKHPRFRNKAEDCFHRGIKLDPFNDDLHADLAEFYADNGLYLRARTHCLRALEMVPNHPRVLEILSRKPFEKLGKGGCCCEHDHGCHHR